MTRSLEAASSASELVRLPRAFYRRDAIRVARGLLGQRLVHRVDGHWLGGRIVETEAYVGIQDKAAHSYGGRRTKRTETMYADGGTAYVYLNYGIHNLFNIVVANQDDPQAVLIRALEPTHGIERMVLRRPKARQLRDLCSGPGKLAAALAIELSHDRVDLVEHDRLFVQQLRRRSLPERKVTAAPRIGIGYAGQWAHAPLRFYISDSPHVSVKWFDRGAVEEGGRT